MNEGGGLQRRLKRADLVSGLGAVLLGLGLGVLVAQYLAAFALPLLGLGLAIHGWGMFDKHRLQRRSEPVPPWWSEALYWICWAGLAVAAGLIAAQIAGWNALGPF